MKLDRRTVQTSSKLIADQCKAGRLITGLRPIIGGDVTLINPSLWNTELFWNRFEKCQMSFRRPFIKNDDDDYGEETGWIFVKHDSLEQLLSFIHGSVTPMKPLTERETIIIEAYQQEFPDGSRGYHFAQIENRINDWVAKTQRHKVSSSSIKRALAKHKKMRR